MPLPLPLVSTYLITDPQSDPEIDELINQWASNPAMCLLNIFKPQSIEFWKMLDATLFAKRPDIMLRAYGPCGTDLAFLMSMPNVRRVSISTPSEEPAKYLDEVSALPQWESLFVKDNTIKDLSFLENAPEDLTHLAIGSDWIPHRDLDSSVISRFKNLRYLSVGGCRRGLMSAINQLPNLRSLKLHSSVQLKPQVMEELTALVALQLSDLTAKNLSGLANLIGLRMLSLCGVKSLSDLSFISALKELQHLQLGSLNSLTVLPDLRELRHLDAIELEYLKKIEETTGIAQAPALRTVLMEGMERVKPECLEPILTAPALERVRGYFQTKLANKKFEVMCKRHGVLNDVELAFEQLSSQDRDMRFVRIADQAV